MSIGSFTLDRSTGVLRGATVVERGAAFLFATGAKITTPIHWRGFSLGCKAIRTVVSSREIVASLNDDARFAFPFGDGYWSLLFDRAYHYESEIEFFLRAICGLKYCFIDCGANFGYWSVLVSSRPFGAQKVIAIEPSPSNAARLRRNSELNSYRFAVVQKAIASEDGKLVSMDGAKHEAFRVVQTAQSSCHQVETICLDTLMDCGTVGVDQLSVVKLDVEGMEVEALEGGRRLLDSGALVIVEDMVRTVNTPSRAIFSTSLDASFSSSIQRAAALRNSTRFRLWMRSSEVALSAIIFSRP
jgi:FkbM family methyltransferase